MEVNSSNLSFQINSSANSASAGEFKSVEIIASTQNQQTALVPSSSSVVAQLASGPSASVAVYSDLVNSSAALGVVEDSVNSDVDYIQAEMKAIEQLAAVDREVRESEQAPTVISDSQNVSSIFDSYNASDRLFYASVAAGKASIDTSAVENDPRATLEKAQVIMRAALSVDAPSIEDMQIASEAKALALQAISELADASVSDESIVESAQVEEAALKLEEFHAKEELRQAKQEKDQALVDSRKENLQDSLEVLKEFNAEIYEIQETLRRLNVQLVDTGAFTKTFPQGSLFDQNV